MYLLDSDPMMLKICSMKYFGADEFHITRVYYYNVLILMLDGVLKFYEDGRLIVLRKGEYYIQRAGLLQEGLNRDRQVEPNEDAPAVYFFMEFEGGAFSDSKYGVPIRGVFQEQEIRPIISACENAYSVRRQFNRFLMNSYLYRMFSELYPELPDNKQVSNLLSTIKKYIDSEYSSIANVEDIARKFGYNADHLTKIFIQKYKMSPYQYLKSIRMEHAMWLLQNTDMSLEQIAHSVGYDNYSSFYRMFVSTYRFSPGQKRKKK